MSFPTYEVYKTSEFAWLGKVPKHWIVTSLKHFWSVIDCKHITAEFVNDGIPLASIREVQSRFVNLEGAKKTTLAFYEQLIESGREPLAGDLIFSRNATVGEVAQVAEWHPSFAMGQDVCLLKKVYGDFSSDYFQAVLLSTVVREQLENLMIGSTFKRVNVEEIRGLVVPIPRRDEQLAIANFLDRETARIDALIGEQERLIELLKEKRQAVISHAVTKGLDPTVPMKDSGVEWLGEVPAHWIVTRAKFVSKIFIPQRNKPELNESDGLCWVTMEEMKKNYISETFQKVSYAAAEKAGSKTLRKGSVIASCVGRFGIASINQVDVIINQQLQAFMPVKITAEYLRELISLSTQYFELVGTAATLVYVNQQGFENLPVLLPPLNEQEKICSHIFKLSERYQQLISESLDSVKLLQERRSALISAAVTGKIDVRTWNMLASA